MIEMSVEAETVLTGDGVGAILNQSSVERIDLPSPPSTVAVSRGGPFMVDEVLAELPAEAAGQMGRDGAGVDSVGVRGKVLRLKNGVQAPTTPAQQPVRASKRRYSTNAAAVGFKHCGQGKRRRRAASESEPVLPTDFLLGGNIFDPLNLNSLMDEEVNRALNAETPKSSPLPAKSREPVEILVPRDITDPLNLSGRGGHAHKGVLATPMKSGNRRRHRNRHHGGPNAGVSAQHDPADPDRSKGVREEDMKLLFPVLHAVEENVCAVPEVSSDGAVLLGLDTVEESPRPYELNTSINCRDEVVPPILPPPRSNPSANSTQSHTHTGSSHSANSSQSSKHRKRRRTVSRSDRLSITPTPSNKQTSLDRRRSQTFHTPVVGGATGSYWTETHQTHQHYHKPHRKFQYGTYSYYYGYQTPGLDRDPRLAFFKSEWFRGKKVLDIGCNTGHMTLAIAKNWSPAHILGLDIDGRLVHAARQNLRHFLSELKRQEVHRDLQRRNAEDEEAHGRKDVEEKMETHGETRDKEENMETHANMGTNPEVAAVERAELQVELLQPFPISFRLYRGPISAPPLLPPTAGVFPNNVAFMKGNYVPESNAYVMSQRAEYDVILCLSVTKWVHLNWGDAGLQRLFRRAYRHLTAGGVMILQAQPWSSYSRRKRLTETTYRNYNSIRLKPEQFSSYLTNEVGFTSYQLISTEGLQKPIYIFHKGPASSRK
ncbi:7SK snRNA methylphosphate capping enzyme [Electrophorus electricus]|uniref:RNA methyltransferase n=1 Tax=Electrophorus electricus TaxID=8005 RepID=A0A4W4E147_ELEEL|nr:7SK snRNA methylphosphate capping enzyme [Electrophorus electricus]XP_026852880.2 7SK snRNA methylphosphate capping enzyme [Electrophorus electricus]XP_026852881.2 7SK snRNA methylphosphate capping enzyme [Electrophorus electricus]XP_026852885.2 7SK snRNA methylphosphate capping enzyme [Electrophorus electricus]XP_035377518.1 7SK snRNA methylphosphate capping enzyme [Electrophorus electricus]XP_035377519.1 7SK snRNA methylphosphate capping enzyme [Electrophorus electricus]XP_035377520.1 7S